MMIAIEEYLQLDECYRLHRLNAVLSWYRMLHHQLLYLFLSSDSIPLLDGQNFAIVNG